MTTPLRRRLRSAGIVLALLAAIGAWWAGLSGAPRSGPDPGVARSSGDGASAAAGAQVLAWPASAASALPSLDPAWRAAPSDAQARAQLMQRMQADWCGFGAAEHNRQTEAVWEKAGAGGQPIGMEAIAEANRTPGAEVMEEAVAQVRQRWVAALQRRGDPRSVAVAEYLGGADGDATQAGARLQALARTSADPMVTALALQRPCGPGVCRNVDRAQWSRLEPANLQAWLALLGEPAAHRTQEAYALERMASEARYSRSYAREFAALLFSLPQSETPGLAHDAELQLIDVALGRWRTEPWAPLTRMCRTGGDHPAQHQLCEAVAELMWQSDDLLERSLAMTLARGMVARLPALKARWEPRAREFEALRHWYASVWERRNSASMETMQPCEMMADQRRHLQANAAQGEWNRWRREMQADGADEAALSAEWRRQNGRGSLDPPPPPAPASRSR